MIDETNLIKAVLKSMENDRHLTHEASKVHFQEHRYLLNLIEKQPKVKIDGNTSDGYHTFNELYHHRAILFSVICNQNKEIAWKSKQHHDGSMYDGMFIVGVETPQGQYSYHYDIEPYWNMFNVKELEFAPEWDGHEPSDIVRLSSIESQPKIGEWIPVEEALPKEHEVVLVWYEYFRYGDYNRMYQTYGFGYHFRNGFWSGDVSGEKARCIAWQPLPKPYEVEDET